MRELRIALAALASHWRRHGAQCMAIVVGVWLATSLWSGVQALNSQARADYARASDIVAGAAQARLVWRTGERFDQDVFVRLRRLGWPVSPVLEGSLRLRQEGPATALVRVVGIEPLTLPQGAGIAGRAGAGMDVGAFIGPPGQAWIAPDTLQRLHLSESAQPQAADGQRLPPLVVEPGLAPGVIVMDIGRAQTLLGVGKAAPVDGAGAGDRGNGGSSGNSGGSGDNGNSVNGVSSGGGAGAVSALLMPSGFAAALPALPPDLAPLLRVEHPDEAQDLRRMTDSFHLNLTALGALSFIVGLFIVHAAIGLALEQRRALLRTLRACGVSLRILVVALTLELGLFALLGGLAGVASGYVIAGALLGNVADSLRGLYGAEIAGHLSLPASWWLGGVAMSIAGVLVAGSNSLLRAARLPVLALGRPQAWRGAHATWLRRQAILAVLLILVALLSLYGGDGLAAAFLLMACVLLAAALLLPVLLDVSLAGLARVCRTPLATWFIADSRQQLPALSLALMALLLALAASAGVGSMTEGFRKTFVAWLDQRLSADLYVTPASPAQSGQVAAWLAGQPHVQAVLPQWRQEVRLQGWPTELQGVADHPATARAWPLLAASKDAWAALDAGQAAFLSEQLARRLHLGLGGRVQMPALQGQPDRPQDLGQSLTVAGIFADYGNAKGHVLVSADWLRAHGGETGPRSLEVHIDAGQADAVRQALEARYAQTGLRVIDQSGLKQWSTQIFERTFSATAALNTLTLAVAGVALFISLLTLGQGRLAQLAPLWALGVTRGRLTALALGQAMALALLTVILALPLGILLAWCLVAVVNVQAFGWRLPLYVFPARLFALGAAGLLTALAAASLPVWQLARRQPAELLRRFADET
jgi:putative ABC transport system permease protein